MTGFAILFAQDAIVSNGSVNSVSNALAAPAGRLILVFILLAVGFWFMLSRFNDLSWWTGVVATAAGLVLVATFLPAFGSVASRIVFWTLAASTMGAAVATIVSRSPMYCAIWFALALLGTGGLMLVQGAQFLGIATVAVYAGAIVVMFLFVLMLAQPQGQSVYDRISWGSLPVALCSLAGAFVVAGAALGVTRLDRSLHHQLRQDVLSALAGSDGGRIAVVKESELRAVKLAARGDNQHTLTLELAAEPSRRDLLETIRPHLQTQLNREISYLRDLQPELEIVFLDVLATDHVARLGGQLFTRHLIAVEVAGTLLLVALVGAVAIVIQGKQGSKGPAAGAYAKGGPA